MKHSVFVLAALLASLTACAPVRPDTGMSSRAAEPQTVTTPIASMDSTQDIVLVVANPIAPASTHAGSNMLGYAPSAHYGAGQRATLVLSDLKQAYGMHEVTGWPIKALNAYCVVLKPPAGADRDVLIAQLSKDGRVQLAQPLQDYSVYADAPKEGKKYNDPYTDLQRGFVETQAAVAHMVTQGEGVHVAVVDTGADMTHPDLQGHIHDSDDAVDSNTASFNHDRHGTEVAGVIAAVGDNRLGMVGIAPKSRVSIYKACWYPPDQRAAKCNSFTLAKALAAVNDTDARIVNLSLGGPADPLLGKLLAQLLSEGRIVVAAMPPDGGTGGFPDNAPGVLVVRTSAVTPAAPGIISAPGDDILTTQPGGGYDFTSGSSMATAHVSGIVALLLSLAPQLDAKTARDILLRTSGVTHGMLEVNAASAVAALRSSQEKQLH